MNKSKEQAPKRVESQLVLNIVIYQELVFKKCLILALVLYNCCNAVARLSTRHQACCGACSLTSISLDLSLSLILSLSLPSLSPFLYSRPLSLSSLSLSLSPFSLPVPRPPLPWPQPGNYLKPPHPHPLPYHVCHKSLSPSI